MNNLISLCNNPPLANFTFIINSLLTQHLQKLVNVIKSMLSNGKVTEIAGCKCNSLTTMFLYILKIQVELRETAINVLLTLEIAGNNACNNC